MLHIMSLVAPEKKDPEPGQIWLYKVTQFKLRDDAIRIQSDLAKVYGFTAYGVRDVARLAATAVKAAPFFVEKKKKEKKKKEKKKKKSLTMQAVVLRYCPHK